VFFGRSGINSRYMERVISILLRIISDELNTTPTSLDFQTINLHQTSGTLKIVSPELVPTSPGIITEMETIYLGPDQQTPPKEDIALKCIETLFYICSDKTPGVDSDIRAAAVGLPLLVDKCKQILMQHIQNKKMTGKFPMSSSANLKIVHILKGMTELVLRPGLPPSLNGSL
jgi:hypothetical protein